MGLASRSRPICIRSLSRIHRFAAIQHAGPLGSAANYNTAPMVSLDMSDNRERDYWFGVFSWAELSRLGFGQRQVARMVAAGDLRHLRRGWYAARLADPRVAQAVAAGGVCSCVTALDLHGVWVPPGHRRRAHARARKSATGGTFCRQYGRPQPERHAVDDVLTAFRHAVRCLDDEGIIVVADSMLNQGMVDLADLRVAVADAPLRIRRLLDKCDAAAESGIETIPRVRFRATGLWVRTQVLIDGVGRVDLLIGNRLIVELDGAEFHDRTAAQKASDRRRDAQATARGYLPLRFSYHEVIHEWGYVADTVGDIVRRGEHLKLPYAARRAE